ncbi:mu-type opioid receptor-like [Exaiptasia diaphana]|uniref:G-protein coupled receptors family 1 profile domain-containing protein n=1 Tax=Exaiptasia diaphana TaxID=2652724 RepID=A0A913YFV8_EXADI|nr:mu-type opioid receptor-like [Exaiptasia diaphana]
MEFDITLIVIFCIVFVFNVTGNSLVIYIISKKQRTSTDHLLLNLAVADLIYGVFLTFYHLSYFLKLFVPKYHNIVFKNDIFCRVFFSGGIASTAYVDSIFTVIILSVERYFAVCRPHGFKKWFSIRNVKCVMLFCWILSAALILPAGNSGKDCMSYDKDAGKTVSAILMVFSISTLIVLVVLFIKICVSLWCKETAIQPTAVREIQERKMKKRVSLCVLAVVITYILCSIPQFIVYVIAAFQWLQENLPVLYQITSLLTLVNSAVDPYLYSFQSQKMRKLFKKIFLCSRRDHSHEPSQGEQSQ